MRVLHLPKSAGSQISIMVQALRDIGVDARGLVLNNSSYETNKSITTYEIPMHYKRPLRGIMQRLAWLRWWLALESSVRWADVIHWHFGWFTAPKEIDLKYISLLRKAALVEFWGSDIRIPEIASKDNPYLKRLLETDESYVISYQLSRLRQERFSQHGFECLIPGPELIDYIQTDLFPSPYYDVAALYLPDFAPHYPDPDCSRPVVVHTPSKLNVKGSEAVFNAVERLSSKYDFEFKLIHKVSHDEALSIISKCDIVLDQFVIGSYGTAALEAMAYGKPTICYIKESFLPRLPSDFAVVNANQDNLVDILEELLRNGKRRYEIGRQSRAYVEKYHDAHTTAKHLVQIYQNLIDKKNKS